MFIDALVTVLAFTFIILTMFGFAGNTMLMILAILYAMGDGFIHLTSTNLLWLTALYIIGEAWEFLVGYLGIRREKVDYLTVFVIGVGSLLGSMLGTFLLPGIGSIVGAAIGAFLTALLFQRMRGVDNDKAWRVACVAAVMHLVALMGKVIVAIIMFILLVANLGWQF